MEGVQYMAAKDYVHRDVKPENVLVKDGEYKVSDFGFATKADMTGRQKMTMCCGTPLYMAPQLLEETAYTSKCDIWSWGLVLYECIFGVTPWPCRDLRSYLFAMKRYPTLRFPYGATVSSELKDFLQRCLTVDEEQRIGWSELFHHPFLRGILGDQ